MALDQLGETADAELGGADHRPDVAAELGQAVVARQQGEHVAPRLAPVHELEDRDDETFGVDVDGVG